MSRFILFVVSLLHARQVVALCLANGVPHHARQYLQNDALENMPVGLLLATWQSSFIMTAIVQILVTEVLGLHTRAHSEMAANSAGAIFAIGGCLDFNKLEMEEKRCGLQETQIHVALDAWVGVAVSEQTTFQYLYPSQAPEDMGGMGYRGFESMYVTMGVSEQAYNAEGLALNFYRSYNTTHHDAKRYFQSIFDVNFSVMIACANGTAFMNEEHMGNYYRWTGDIDGVELQPDGTYIGKCSGPGGYWWLAPSCRHDVMACIPLVTTSNGWFLQALLQWSTTYGIPAAVGIIPSFADWSRTVKTTRSLFYWWTPDATFLELQPESIVFPPFRASEWVLGNKRTSGSGTYIAKLTSPNLRQKSPRLRSFISKLSMDLNDLTDILHDVRTLPITSLDLWWDAACSWIQKNEHIWSTWIPIDTNCFLGYGVVDEHGTFLSSKTGAVSCDVCPPGTFSEDLPDGQSRRCTPCPPGSSQNKAAASRCHECQPGSVGATEGSVACTPCAVGFYQDASGKAACVACSNDTTTLLLGASKPEDCVCQIDLIESNLQCVPCGEGLTCPRGSTVEQLMHGQNTTAGERPQILQSYFSWPEEPLEIYKCPGQHCPGGVPGSCTEVRLGPTCDECPARMYATSDGCQSCEIPLVAAWIGGLCGLLLLIISVYYFAETRYMLKASLVECAKIGCDMTLNFMQNLGVLNSVFVPWPEGLRNLLKFSALFLFNLRSLGFNCALGSAVQQYMTMVSFFFGMTLSWPCLGYLSQFHCFRKRNLAWKFHRTLGVTGSFLQLSFTTLCNVGLVPFMCFSHPNGRKSIAKYPNIFCGSPDHLTMQTLAVFILILGLTHFIMCCWAIWSAPAWSVKARRRLPAVHFLIANFKPSVWWFGAVILLRGPLISLPTVVATDLPGVNLALLICVWLSYYSIQLVCLPWKAPILNLVDGISTMLFLVLLAVSLHLEPVIAESILILEILGVGVYYLSLGVIVCVSILSIMLMVLKRFRCSARTNHIVNLGQLPDPKEMLETIEQIYFNLKAKQDMGELVNKMSTTLSADDLHIVQKALDILSTDCELGESVSTSRTSFYRISANRISQMSGTSLSLMVQDMDEAAQSKVSKRLKEEESISEIAESGEIEKEEAREDFPEPNSVDISAEEDTILEENLDEVDVKL